MSMDFHPKEMKRAARRAHRARKLNKVSKKVDHQYNNPSQWWDGFDEWKKSYVRRHADNPTSCSCWMCCNPRRYGELTMQEKRILQCERESDS